MTAPNNRERILPRLIDDEIKESFINYSMSVIVSRALPDVRDGLKPVHRRVLYSMFDTGLVPGRPYKKCATVVGDVLGKYHPHGDSSVYDALVRMVQDFSLRYPLIDGQGNFGSVEGDPPAAYRYTESRLMPIAMEMLADIEKNTVDFVPNFDDALEEPSVLPAGIPNLVVNGSSGIAVGMATNIPPHNLREVIGAIVHLDRQSRRVDERPQEVHQGSRLPDGRLHLRPRRHQGLSGDGSRAHRHARARGDRGEGILEQVADRRHRDSVSGQQREADREHRRPRARQEARGHLRPAQRVRQGRHAHRHRAEARCDSARGAESAVQAHGDAVDVRRHHAGARARRAHGQPRAEGDAAQGGARALHRAPPRRHRPPHAVRSRQGARARAHPRGSQDRRRQHRRGDQGHSQGRRTRRRRARSFRSGSSCPSGRPRRSSTCASPSSPASRSRSWKRS